MKNNIRNIIAISWLALAAATTSCSGDDIIESQAGAATPLSIAIEDAGFAAKQMEVWKEINLLELNLESGSLYMEDFQDSLQKEDEALLTGLGQKYVYAVSYPETESSAVKHMMEKLLSVFGGKLASDTEDFTPFLTVGEL